MAKHCPETKGSLSDEREWLRCKIRGEKVDQKTEQQSLQIKQTLQCCFPPKSGIK